MESDAGRTQASPGWSAAVARGQPRPDGGQRSPSGGRPPVILADGVIFGI